MTYDTSLYVLPQTNASQMIDYKYEVRLIYNQVTIS